MNYHFLMIRQHVSKDYASKNLECVFKLDYKKVEKISLFYRYKKSLLDAVSAADSLEWTSSCQQKTKTCRTYCKRTKLAYHYKHCFISDTHHRTIQRRCFAAEWMGCRRKISGGRWRPESRWKYLWQSGSRAFLRQYTQPDYCQWEPGEKSLCTQ